MSLDAFLRCTCISHGRAKPHPFPERLAMDESGPPAPTRDPSEQKWEANDLMFVAQVLNSSLVLDPAESGLIPGEVFQ